MVSINGVMARNTKDNGLIIKCTERVSFGGLMEKNTLEILMRIKDMAKVSSFGKMEENMRANGLEENNMVSEFIEMEREKKEKDNG